MEETKLKQPRSGIKEIQQSNKASQIEKSDYIFWHILTQGEDQNFKDVKIDHLIMCELLYASNFRRYDIEDSSIFIQIINDRIIKQVTITTMMDFIYNYIDSLPKDINKPWGGIDIIKQIKKKVLSGAASFFNVQKLYILKPKEPIEFNKDTMSEKFMYFENGFVKITAEAIEFLPYSKLKGYVWENEIIKREYLKPTNSKKRNVVKDFFYLVSGKKESRFRDLCIAAGYYSHDFYDYKLKALVLTDSTISLGSESNGRTGKTLFCRLIGGMLSHNSENPAIKTYVEINAKDFDPREKFKYSACALETKLIVLNDLKRGFDVDCVYNDVTEGIDVNKKGLHPFKIRAKLILTSNKTLKLAGDSDTDRFLEFEFSNHFSKSHGPLEEFGHWFFRDWDNEQYCMYYYFMAQCVQLYFKNGCKLNEPEQINLNRRKLIEQTHEDFIEWITSFNPEPNKVYKKDDLFKSFTDESPDWSGPNFKQRKFTEWLKAYCNFSDHLANYDKSKNERRDSQTRYFTFIAKK